MKDDKSKKADCRRIDGRCNEHDFLLTSDGTTAKVKCGELFCPYTTDKEYKASINIDYKDLYATEADACVILDEGFPGEISVGPVYYTGRDGTAYSKSNTAPSVGGNYTASVEISDGKNTVTIHSDYRLNNKSSSENPGKPNVPGSPDILTSTGVVESADVYIAQVNPSIVVAMDAVKSDEKDILEYKWIACEEKNPSVWFELSPWTENNQYLNWKPDSAGDYIIVGYVRVVGNEEKSEKSVPFGVNYKMIKEICQMPYSGGGYLIGFESYENPNQEYGYEMFVMDLSLLAAGSPTPWVHATGKIRLPESANPAEEKTMWTVWQPQYGYYLTLFRLYDKDGNMIDEVPYGFANAY